MEALQVLTHVAEQRGFFVYQAPPKLPKSYRKRFENWLAAGMHAGMDYLTRNPAERYDPRRRFPWFKGALVLAAPYAAEEPPRPKNGLRLGRVARYAWTRDYHLWIAPVISELEAVCQKLGGTCKGYVDYGPVPERAFAAVSGGGWLGRNGLWLTQEAGSYQYLAVLLTSWPVEANESHPNRCGSCNACISNCPTGAIVANSIVDSRLCLSYWTIEHRGLIPLEIWRQMGSWLFGCDDCQTICPWNRKPQLHNFVTPDPELAWPNIENFFGISNRAFARRYAGSAFLRSGRTILARNALIVLSNTNAEALKQLLPLALVDPSAKVRATAIAAAASIGFNDIKYENNFSSSDNEYIQNSLLFFR